MAALVAALPALGQMATSHPRSNGVSLVSLSPRLQRAIGPLDLVGTWKATLEHNGQSSELVVRFSLDDGGLRAVVSLPTLDAWDAVSTPVTLVDDRVEISSWVLTRRPDGGLSGELPAWLVPVHRIPFTLYRTGPITPPAPAVIDAKVAEPVWARDLGSPIWAGLSTRRGVVYVGDDSGHLNALDAKTGRTLWQYATGGAIRARPTVTESTLFVHSDDGLLHALSPQTGDLIWRVPVAAAKVERIPLGAQGSRYNHYASSALALGKVVYLGGFDGRVYALDAASGARLWQFESGGTVAGTPSAADGRLFFGSFDGRVYALDASSGRKLWHFDTGAPVVSSPLVHDGRVIVGSRSYDLLALDAVSGTLDWKYYYWFSWIESSAVERGGIAYLGSSDAQLVVALKATSGAEQWRFDSGGSPWSTPAVTDSTVFVGTVGVADYMVAHQANFVALDRHTGKPRWHYPLARPDNAGHWGFGASATADDTMVFAAGLDGRVRAFRQDP